MIRKLSRMVGIMLLAAPIAGNAVYIIEVDAEGTEFDGTWEITLDNCDWNGRYTCSPEFGTDAPWYTGLSTDGAVAMAFVEGWLNAGYGYGFNALGDKTYTPWFMYDQHDSIWGFAFARSDNNNGGAYTHTHHKHTYQCGHWTTYFAFDDHFTWAAAKATRVSVPEPGTLALLGLGLAGMGMVRRKKIV